MKIASYSSKGVMHCGMASPSVTEVTEKIGRGEFMKMYDHKLLPDKCMDKDGEGWRTLA